MLYQDKKGYEDYWRKHQVSPIARDIWTYTPGKKPVYQKQTTFGGEDREPVWSPDGKSFYYLSEEKGSFNIFQRNHHFPTNHFPYKASRTFSKHFNHRHTLLWL